MCCLQTLKIAYVSAQIDQSSLSHEKKKKKKKKKKNTLCIIVYLLSKLRLGMIPIRLCRQANLNLQWAHMSERSISDFSVQMTVNQWAKLQSTIFGSAVVGCWADLGSTSKWFSLLLTFFLFHLFHPSVQT